MGRFRIRLRRITLVPVNTIRPVISGATGGVGASGDLLSVSTGTWTNSPTSYSYQWKKADAVTNSGVLVTYEGNPVWNEPPTNLGTAQTQAIGAAEVGTIIFCTVTATKSGVSSTIDTNEVGMVT